MVLSWDQAKVTDLAGAAVDLSAADSEIWVTFKAGDGTIERRKITADTAPGKKSHAMQVTLDHNQSYWVDVSVRSRGVFDAMSSVDLKVVDQHGLLPVVKIPVQVNGPAEAEIFTGGYRGWSVAGYRGGGARRSLPIDEALLSTQPAGTPSGTKYSSSGAACTSRLSKAQCDSKSTSSTPDYLGPDGPEFDPADVPGKQKDAYVFTQKLTAKASGAADDRLVGPREEIYAQGLYSGAARLADIAALGQTPGSASGTMWAPKRMGFVAPNLGLSGGAFGMGASFNIGWNMADQSFLDMNGDQFPDVVNKRSTLYSDPRGGRRCVQPDQVVGSCLGGGPGDWTNWGFSISAGASLNGAVGNAQVNSTGTANATRGGAAAKGGGSDGNGSYGAFLGAGGGVNYSFTNPVTTLPDWKQDKGDFEFALGDPFDVDSQKTLADVNGDGLPDRVRVVRTGVYVRFGLGYGFTDTWVPWARSLAFEQNESLSGSLNAGGGGSFVAPYVEAFFGVSTSASTNFARWSWNDVNADGLLDAVHKGADGVKVRFGTGSGLSAATRYGAAAIRSGQFLATGETFGVVDQGGEQIRQDSSVQRWAGGSTVTVGIPLCAAACYLILGVGGQGAPLGDGQRRRSQGRQRRRAARLGAALGDRHRRRLHAGAVEQAGRDRAAGAGARPDGPRAEQRRHRARAAHPGEVRGPSRVPRLRRPRVSRRHPTPTAGSRPWSSTSGRDRPCGSSAQVAVSAAGARTRLGGVTSACGRLCHSAQSALTSPAARSRWGRWSSSSVSTLVSAAWTVTFMAARTAPVPSRTGTATERTPGASSSSARAHPRARTWASSSWSCSPNPPRRRPMYAGNPAWLGCASVGPSRSGGSAASSTLPCEVCAAGKRVPISTRSAMIFGTETRAT